jgi:hypothetical protein
MPSFYEEAVNRKSKNSPQAYYQGYDQTPGRIPAKENYPQKDDKDYKYMQNQEKADFAWQPEQLPFFPVS